MFLSNKTYGNNIITIIALFISAFYGGVIKTQGPKEGNRN